MKPEKPNQFGPPTPATRLTGLDAGISGYHPSRISGAWTRTRSGSSMNRFFTVLLITLLCVPLALGPAWAAASDQWGIVMFWLMALVGVAIIWRLRRR